MRKSLAALLVLLPVLAAAQYEPPPPGYAPAPAQAGGAYGSRRAPWYIGFGLGTGDGNIGFKDQSYTFQEMHGTSPTNVSLNFKIGATITPELLAGFDVTAIRSQADQGGFTTALQITNYDAMVTWFPQGEGLFLRGGVGFTKLLFEASDDVSSMSSDFSGYNVLVGAGYAFWLSQSFNLTLNADYSAQRYGSSDTDPESSNFFHVWVGFDWY
jgi:hypothetical protein